MAKKTAAQLKAADYYAQIQQHVDALARLGASSFKEGVDTSVGQKVGMALAHLLVTPVIVDLCFTALEDQNAHLAAAALLAMEGGNHLHRQGSFERKGRTLTITLPEWWEDGWQGSAKTRRE